MANSLQNDNDLIREREANPSSTTDSLHIQHSAGSSGSYDNPGNAASEPLLTPRSINEKENTKQGYYNDDPNGTSYPSLGDNILSRFSIIGRNKGKTAIIVAAVGLGSFGVFSFLQAPLAVMNAGAVLQKIFGQSMNDFTGDRSLRQLYFTASGQSERGRLSKPGNYIADKYENYMLEKSGIRFVYNANFNGTVGGIEIVDKDKAYRSGTINRILNSVEGSKVAQASTLDGLDVRRSKGEAVPGNSTILRFQPGTSPAELRQIGRIVMDDLELNKPISALGNNLMKKRNKVKRTVFTGKAGAVYDSISDRIQRARNLDQERKAFIDEQNEYIREGTVKPNIPGEVQDKLDEADEQAGEESENSSHSARTALRSIAVKAAGPTVVLGALCAVNDLGDNVEETNYKNTVQTSIRLYSLFAVAGEQTTAGQSDLNVSFQEIGILNELMYDEEAKNNFNSAAAVKAANGKDPTNGVMVSDELRPASSAGKPLPFEVVSNIMGYEFQVLGAGGSIIDAVTPGDPAPKLSLEDGCGFFDAIAGAVPFFDEITGFVDDGINLALGLFDTSTDELYYSLVSLLTNDAIGLDSRGGELGAIAAMGAQLGKNDAFADKGGSPMTPLASAELSEELFIAEQSKRNSQSIKERYLDPMTTGSFANTLAAGTQETIRSGNIASLFSVKPLSQIIFGTTHAATTSVSSYDMYGVYDFDFSVALRDNPLFADPYENFAIVEENIDSLNEKYGKCFASKLNFDGDKILIESGDFNMLKVQSNDEYADCRKFQQVASANYTPAQQRGTSFAGLLNPFKSIPVSAQADPAPREMTDEEVMFHRYRFALADANINMSTVCFLGEPTDEETLHACDQIGYGANESEETGSQTVGEPPDEINGYTLSDTEKANLKYIAENVVNNLQGTQEEKVKIAAESAWWALKEGVLKIEQPRVFGYSNCEVVPPGTPDSEIFSRDDGNNHIGVTIECPQGQAWQVGISGVQVTHNADGNLRSLATSLHGGKSIKEILEEVATLAGQTPGSPKYEEIINSEGYLQASLLLRDPRTGITIVNRDLQPCLSNSAPTWCDFGDDRINRNQEARIAAIQEIKNYFSGAGSETSSGSRVSGTAQELAREILNNSNIDLSASNFCRYCSEDITNMAEGRPAYGNVQIDIRILQFLAELGREHKVDVNSISGAGTGHTTGSNHFSGQAIDFGCNGTPSGTIMDSVGEKYGVSSNYERCPRENHWHYSTNGR